MTRSSVHVLEAIASPRLLVLGDLMLDRYLEGTVARISPEGPIPVLDVAKERNVVGAAGFTAQAASVLGAQVGLIGVVGDDAASARIRAALTEQGVAWWGVHDPSRPTSVKTRLLARNHNTSAQQIVRVDQERRHPLAASVEAEILARIEEHLPAVDAVLINDYGKGALTPGVLRAAISGAKAAGIPVIVDPHKGTDFSGYGGATALTPNRQETSRSTSIQVTDLVSAREAGAALLSELALAYALITLDRDGMLLAQRDGDAVHVPTRPRDVFDVTGAGDMVLAVFGLALASGAEAREAAVLANVAAGLEVEQVGVAPITRDALRARLLGNEHDTDTKRVARERVAALGERLRAEGRTVVFTNGCFDVLHAGHVRYLAQARREGDVLVVGVNSDASVTRLKGTGRPVHTLADRLEVLAALGSVDHVVAFEEDTPLDLVEALAPDVLVKGADYADKPVVGRECVEARGGRVVLAPLLPGRSTSEALAALRGESGPRA